MRPERQRMLSANVRDTRSSASRHHARSVASGGMTGSPTRSGAAPFACGCGSSAAGDGCAFCMSPLYPARERAGRARNAPVEGPAEGRSPGSAFKSRLAPVALVAALLTPAFGAAAAPAPFPRLGLYGSVLGDGFPYVHADGSLDTLEIGRAARFTEVVLDVYPISPYRP